MRLNVFNSLMGLCVATAAVSCSDGLVEDNLRPVGGESDMISFVVANENNATRGGSYGNRPCGGAILRSSDGADSLYLNMEVSDIADEPATRAIGEFSSENKPTVLHMSCRLRNNDSEKPYRYYFKDTEFSKGSGDIWSSNPAIYWFPEGTHYNFFGYYAPKEAETLKFNGNGEDDSNSDFSFIPKLEYTVPEDLAKHIDLAYSLPKPYENIAASSAPESVPVTIKHALTKIILKTGSNMADGVIESVSFTDVKCRGKLNIGTVKDPDAKYDDQECEWTLDDSTQDFTLSGLNVKGNNQDITPAEKCFMLLPESATANSKIVIMFRPEGTLAEEPAKEYKLTLSDIPNLESWKAGKCYTYTINIKPEVGIVIEDLPEYVDAHYVIAKARVIVPEDKPDTEWKLRVSGDKDASIVVKDGEDVAADKKNPYQELYEQGYWLDKVTANSDKDRGKSARGINEVSGKGSKELYIFVPENYTNGNESNRKISINLVNDDDSVQELAYFTQLPPLLNGDFYIERFEEGDYPWGFNWDSDLTITYRIHIDSFWSGLFSLLYNYLWKPEYVHPDYEGSIWDPIWKLTINFSELNGIDVATDFGKGWDNTKAIYEYNGAKDAVAIMTQLESWGMTPDKDPETLATNPTEFAARACAMKNKFNIELKVNNSTTALNPILNEDDFVWYLPAVNEAANMKDEKFNLDGNYWTSTAIIDPGTTAYQFTYGGSSSGEKRSYKLHVRACRQRN